MHGKCLLMEQERLMGISLSYSDIRDQLFLIAFDVASKENPLRARC